MSELDTDISPDNSFSSRIPDLEDEIKRLKSEIRYKDYRMSWMQAEIRLLNDTMKKQRDKSSDVIEEIQTMNEKLEFELTTGRYLKWDGTEIYYKGEEVPTSHIEREKEEAAKKRQRDDAYEDYKVALSKTPNLFKFHKQN